MTTCYIDMNKVKRTMWEKGWSWAELAQRAGLSLSTMFSLQSKRRKASERTMYKLATALNVEPADIVEKEN